MKNVTISNLMYHIVVNESGIISQYTFTFDRLFNNEIAEGNDYEFVYALNEIIEEVMKLSMGKCFSFKANRDSNSVGSIFRIS
jgi:hypothetical protein